MRSKKGTVVSKSGDKTIVVEVHTYRQHSKYKKKFRVTSKFHAHDEKGEYKVGDKVEIYETKPISKMKRFTTEKPEETQTKETQK